jgi:hypothetical protein
MKMLWRLFLLLACLTIANVQSCEPKNKYFNKGGFFTGVSTAYGIPTFFLGHAIYSCGKDSLKHCFFSCERSKAAHSDMLTGASLKIFGVGLVVIPMLINNRELLKDQSNRLRNSDGVKNE